MYPRVFRIAHLTDLHGQELSPVQLCVSLQMQGLVRPDDTVQ